MVIRQANEFTKLQNISPEGYEHAQFSEMAGQLQESYELLDDLMNDLQN